MPVNDLTSLQLVKQYAITTGNADTRTQDDTLLSGLITTLSSTILSKLSRSSLLSLPRQEIFTGTDNTFNPISKRPFRYLPVTSVQGVSINGSLVQQAIPGTSFNSGSGWSFDPWDGFPPGRQQFISLSGFGFNGWFPNNCTLNYTAGYLFTETFPIAGGGDAPTSTPSSPYGLWAMDNGAIFLNGQPLTRATLSTPMQNQYIPPNPLDPSAPTYNYIFNIADLGKQVTVSYSYIPSGLELACRQWVVDMYKYRDRVATRSQSQGGIEVASFDITDIPLFVKLAMQPYVSVSAALF